MNRPNFVRIPLYLCAAFAFLAGCGAQLPASNGLLPTGAGPTQSAAKRGALLYISDTLTSDVYVYSYPKGKLVMTLADFNVPSGECVDASGDVFVANTGDSDIVEYAHGEKTPVAKLKDAGYFPVGCSVDPESGNLAVTNFPFNGSGQGDVVIYDRAKGRPKHHYADAAIADMLLCSYDGSGNLFLDGLTSASAFAFAELPKGGSKLIDITLNRSIASAGGVEWDGKYVAVGDQSTSTIYQFSISGTSGTEEGSTQLSGATQIFQFWIDGAKLIGPDSGQADAGIWNYPAGGAPVKTITGLYAPLGAVVSR